MSPHPPPQPIIGVVIIIGVILACIPWGIEVIRVNGVWPMLVLFLFLIVGFWFKGVLKINRSEES